MTRKHLGLIIQMIGTIALLFFLFKKFDWNSFWLLLSDIPLWFYFFSLSIVFLGAVLYTIRWQCILNSMGIKLPFLLLLRQYLIGAFFNNFLPTGIGGDWARIYYLGQQHGFVSMTASVFMDRFLGFFSLTLVGTILCWLLNPSSMIFTLSKNLLTACLLMFFTIFLIAGFAPIEKLLLKALIFIPRSKSIIEKLQKFIDQVRLIGKNPTVLFAAVTLVSCYLLTTAVVYYSFFERFSSGNINLGLVVAALSSIDILTNIPISVNGIGLREQLHYLLFATVGVSKEVSVSMSLLIFSNILALSLAGYFCWLRLKLSQKP
ncbi:flippase-like domain-containing protein [Lusitaniella coriacea LEGE 07157]|uniref:Flippase-like domain-containing protein n=1 Tax=Lusitaniella coriacea LEGE 07157 TaxID=945747 RepID=A0A8J7DX48_9CYAN|nr:lysylphosphatidylglycerol synthase transmembrane domain-containing protein [Lusitaniella coriacea]MBE9116874.1 flippase-like domain-containing protein [Lusitaniella coriacea LEGE 07157]